MRAERIVIGIGSTEGVEGMVDEMWLSVDMVRGGLGMLA